MEKPKEVAVAIEKAAYNKEVDSLIKNKEFEGTILVDGHLLDLDSQQYRNVGIGKNAIRVMSEQDIKLASSLENTLMGIRTIK